MSNNDVKRLEIHTRLTEVLGTNVADHLMEYLPAVGWADIARKADIAVVSSRLDSFELRFDNVTKTMWAVASVNWALTIALIGIVLGSR
jgi:hypothetical protein